MTAKYTSHGASRAGDDYQDLWGAQILVEFLENPEKYQWIKFEAHEFKHLDDIVALTADNKFVLRQIKFTVDPEREDLTVNWDWLLNRKEGVRTKSLLQKWASSVRNHIIDGTLSEAILLTNRKPSDEIKPLFSGNYIDFSKIEDAEIRERVIEQIGTEDEAAEFFKNFQFSLANPSYEVLESHLKDRFFKLNGSELGWLSLLNNIRLWVKHKDIPDDTRLINLHTVRAASRWGILKELPQRFEIPDDFVLASDAFHDDLFESIKDKKFKNCGIFGRPGVGKSTYLSYLVEKLKEANIPTIRHHYWLSTDDSSGDRTKHDRVGLSLMQQINSHHPDSIKDIGSFNPSIDELRDWITEAAQYFEKENKPIVVIIDGLDHVWREARSAVELSNLFNTILPTPDNVVLIVGTQDIPDDHLPPKLLSYLPKRDWIQLPLMTNGSIFKWLHFHKEHLDLPDDYEHQNRIISEIASSFLNISEGHPLHLKYTFKRLLNKGQKIQKSTIESMPPCSDGEIENYYDGLYNSLTEPGKQMLHILASNEFTWPLDGLIKCLSDGGLGDSNVISAEKNISHLLKHNVLGYSPYHGSLVVFLRQHPQHDTYSKSIQPRVLFWLKNEAPEYWRWAFEWIVGAEAGDAEDLINRTNREWLIESLSAGWPLDQIIKIINLASVYALKNYNLPKSIELNTLALYTYNGPKFQVDGIEDLVDLQLKLVRDPAFKPVLLAHLKNHPDEILAKISGYFCRRPSDIPQKCLEIYYRRIEESRDLDESSYRINQHTFKNHIDLLTTVDDFDLERLIINLAIQ